MQGARQSGISTRIDAARRIYILYKIESLSGWLAGYVCPLISPKPYVRS
jgi:hypothetical protein